MFQYIKKIFTTENIIIGIYSICYLLIMYSILIASNPVINIQSYIFALAIFPIIYFNYRLIIFLGNDIKIKKFSKTGTIINFIITLGLIILLFIYKGNLYDKLGMTIFAIAILFMLDFRIILTIAINIGFLSQTMLMLQQNDIANNLVTLIYYIIITALICFILQKIFKNQDLIKINYQDKDENVFFNENIYDKITIIGVAMLGISSYILKNLKFEINGFISIISTFVYIFLGLVIFNKFKAKKLLKSQAFKYLLTALTIPFIYFIISIIIPIFR